MFDFIWWWAERRAERVYDAGYAEAEETFFSARDEYERLRAFSLATNVFNKRLRAFSLATSIFNSGVFFKGFMDGWAACRAKPRPRR